MRKWFKNCGAVGLCCVLSFLVLPSVSAQELGSTITQVDAVTVVSADGCSETTTTTTTVSTFIGQDPETETYEEQPPPSYEITGVTTESVTTDLPCVEPPVAEPPVVEPPEDEVLGVTLVNDEDEVLGVTLVRTGSDVDKPIALGAMLIGVGGIFVATSKKRRNNES
jgi:hypothetical protein